MIALTATGADAFTTATPNTYFVTLLSIGPTKTGNRRDVEMTDMLLAALRRHRKQQAEVRLACGDHWTTDPRWADLVFTSEVGTRTWRRWSSATATAPTAWSRPTSRCSGR